MCTACVFTLVFSIQHMEENKPSSPAPPPSTHSPALVRSTLTSRSWRHIQVWRSFFSQLPGSCFSWQPSAIKEGENVFSAERKVIVFVRAAGDNCHNNYMSATNRLFLCHLTRIFWGGFDRNGPWSILCCDFYPGNYFNSFLHFCGHSSRVLHKCKHTLGDKYLIWTMASGLAFNMNIL